MENRKLDVELEGVAAS